MTNRNIAAAAATRRQFSAEEDRQILSLREAGLSVRTIALRLKRSESSTLHRWYSLSGRTPPPRPRRRASTWQAWTPGEDARLEAACAAFGPALPPSERWARIAERLAPRSAGACRNRAERLQVRTLAAPQPAQAPSAPPATPTASAAHHAPGLRRYTWDPTTPATGAQKVAHYRAAARLVARVFGGAR